MTAALVGSKYWPVGGGMEIYLRHLAQALSGEGADVRVVTRFASQDSPEIADLHTRTEEPRQYADGRVRVNVIAPPRLRRHLLRPVYRLHFRAPRLAAALMHAAHRKALRSALAGAHVVHYSGNGRELLGFAAHREARRLGVPFVITPHTHAGAWGDGPLDIDLYRRADAVVALTADERSRLIRAGVSNRLLHVVEHGVSVQGGGDGSAFRERYGLLDHPVVLFLGRRTPDKGYDLLLEAAPLLWRMVPEARVVLAGSEGPPRTLPEAVADRRVVELGRISDAEREDAYAACDVFCLPSEAEAFGLVALEAWAYGKPVVVSDIPTLVERLSRGGGLVAQRTPDALAEALAQVLTDTGLRERLGGEAHELARRSTWSQTARTMINVYAAAGAME